MHKYVIKTILATFSIELLYHSHYFIWMESPWLFIQLSSFPIYIIEWVIFSILWTILPLLLWIITKRFLKIYIVFLIFLLFIVTYSMYLIESLGINVLIFIILFIAIYLVPTKHSWNLFIKTDKISGLKIWIEKFILKIWIYLFLAWFIVLITISSLWSWSYNIGWLDNIVICISWWLLFSSMYTLFFTIIWLATKKFLKIKYALLFTIISLPIFAYELASTYFTFLIFWVLNWILYLIILKLLKNSYMDKKIIECN